MLCIYNYIYDDRYVALARSNLIYAFVLDILQVRDAKNKGVLSGAFSFTAQSALLSISQSGASFGGVNVTVSLTGAVFNLKYDSLTTGYADQRKCLCYMHTIVL